MFNSMRRRSPTAEFREPGTDEPDRQRSGRSIRQPDVGGGRDTTRENLFLQETAALRGQIEAERRMSPGQEAHLHAVACHHGIAPRLGCDYQKFRELWAAENGEQVYLASLEAPIPLRADEHCCFLEPTIWGHLKVINSPASYSVFSTTFPIERGASYRIGSLRPRHKILDSVKEMAIGSLCITNQRLIFEGGAHSTNITFHGIVNIECYSNGIEVAKTNGRSDFFQLATLASEFAYMIIQEFCRVR